jgi:hypothetical protein
MIGKNCDEEEFGIGRESGMGKLESGVEGVGKKSEFFFNKPQGGGIG